MYGIDVLNLAHQLKSEYLGDLPLDAYAVYAERVVSCAVELINLNDYTQEEYLKDELMVTFASLLPDVQVMLIIEELVADVRSAMRKSFWDPRCKVKQHKKRVGKAFHRIYLVMDLEATVASILTSTMIPTADPYIADLVDDNPTQELLTQYVQQLPRDPE